VNHDAATADNPAEAVLESTQLAKKAPLTWWVDGELLVSTSG
jgi:hypothetical protein